MKREVDLLKYIQNLTGQLRIVVIWLPMKIERLLESLVLITLKDKNNNIKSGIKLNKRLKKFLLNETIYFSLIIASEVITFIKYN